MPNKPQVPPLPNTAAFTTAGVPRERISQRVIDEHEQIIELLMKKYGFSRDQASYYGSALVGRPSLVQDFTDYLDKTKYGGTGSPNLPPGPQLAQKPVHDIHGKVPGAPVAIMPAAATAKHLEDANLSAWQQYSQMLDAAPATSAGVSNAR